MIRNFLRVFGSNGGGGRAPVTSVPPCSYVLDAHQIRLWDLPPPPPNDVTKGRILDICFPQRRGLKKGKNEAHHILIKSSPTNHLQKHVYFYEKNLLCTRLTFKEKLGLFTTNLVIRCSNLALSTDHWGTLGICAILKL